MKLESSPVDLALAQAVLPAFRQTRRTAVNHLHHGENTLIVHTRPLEEPDRPGCFGAAFITPDGQAVADLT